MAGAFFCKNHFAELVNCEKPVQKISRNIFSNLADLDFLLTHVWN